MSPKTGAVWEDKEILFDLPYSYLILRSGEKIIDRIEPIEDTKGNSGMKGRLVVTSLRIIWHSLASPRINMSIGYDCMSALNARMVNSGLRGNTQALCMLGSFKGNKYEFIFTGLNPTSTRHYTSVIGVHRAYINSRMYRDLKLRGAFVHNKQLQVLPLEQIAVTEPGVWNLSAESGNVGTMLASNVRVVWFADINDTFNISLPYIMIESISIRPSKFGNALVIQSRPTKNQVSGYILGFRVDPADRLQGLYKEINVLHKSYSEKPEFGVRFTWDYEAPRSHVKDDFHNLDEIGEPRGEMGGAIYLAQKAKPAHAEPVYSPYLGLAIEPLPEGFTLKSLFEVQTIT